MRTLNNSDRITSSSICIGVADWIAQNTYFKNVLKVDKKAFSFVDYYMRKDIPEAEVTSISVFLSGDSTTISEPQKESGYITVQVSFPTGPQRESRAKLIYKTINMIRAQFLNNPNDLWSFVADTYVPGLLFLTTSNKIDYNNLNNQITNNYNVITLNLTMFYKLDLYLNQKWFWDKGYSWYSPDTKIYNEITNVDINLPVVTAFGTILKGYYANPNVGYISTGLLLTVDNFIGKTVLLGRNGSVYTDTFKNTKPSGFSTLYVDHPVPESGYESPGLLILSSLYILGSAAILLGDNGVVYEVKYDGENYTNYNIDSALVSSVNGYDSDGVLIFKKSASRGSAALLFGNDNNLYKTILRI